MNVFKARGKQMSDSRFFVRSFICIDDDRIKAKVDEGRWAILKAELDACYAKLYGLARDELRHILEPQNVHGPDFPGETFRVLKEKEIKRFGEYRTRSLVLEAWDRMFG